MRNRDFVVLVQGAEKQSYAKKAAAYKSTRRPHCLAFQLNIDFVLKRLAEFESGQPGCGNHDFFARLGVQPLAFGLSFTSNVPKPEI